MPPITKPIKLFISYAHADEPLRKELEKHLSLLRRQGFISVWSDRDISAGTDWHGQIDAMMRTATIILLLVSPDFIASDYIWDVELQCVMARHARGDARVIPVILRPSDWKDAPFAKIQALPQDGKPISEWPNIDNAFMNVVNELRKVITAICKP